MSYVESLNKISLRVRIHDIALGHQRNAQHALDMPLGTPHDIRFRWKHHFEKCINKVKTQSILSSTYFLVTTLLSMYGGGNNNLTTC